MGRAPTVALTVAILLLGSACSGAERGPDAERSTVPRGGTLKVGLSEWSGDIPYDPTTFSEHVLLAIYPCCLIRTLYYYNGRPASEGGGILRPDLATGPPQVSADGLTWAIRIRRGIRYGPPLQDVEITAADFVRAMERVLSPAPKGFEVPLLGGFPDYVLQIQGAPDYADGKAQSISGLETPDRYTLRIHLAEPNGDLPYRLSLMQTGPIPPNPFRPGDRFGVAEGHAAEGYGRFLVSSGPYMIEGSEKMDFSKTPAEQEPPSGLDPLVLVRNPSWRPSSDPLRKAYADRIEFLAHHREADGVGDQPFGDPVEEYRTTFARKVDTAEIDVIGDRPTPLEVARRYEDDPSLRQRLRVFEYHVVRWIALNLADPPFDDVHVRRAVNYVMDKRAALEAWERFDAALIYDHLAPNSTENNLLADYHPYPSRGQAGDVAAAKNEMRLSAHDDNRDGVCDRDECDLGTVLWQNHAGYPEIAGVVKQALAKLGITMKPKLVEPEEMYLTCQDPRSHAQLCQLDWIADYPSASTFFLPLYSSQALPPAGSNLSLLGATAKQLRTAGYDVEKVPNVDDRMTACQQAIGVAQLQCWVAFDVYLMEEIVPAIPLFIDAAPWTFSSRVVSFSWDQAAGAPALDKIAIRPGS